MHNGLLWVQPSGRILPSMKNLNKKIDWISTDWKDSLTEHNQKPRVEWMKGIRWNKANPEENNLKYPQQGLIVTDGLYEQTSWLNARLNKWIKGWVDEWMLEPLDKWIKLCKEWLWWQWWWERLFSCSWWWWWRRQNFTSEWQKDGWTERPRDMNGVQAWTGTTWPAGTWIIRARDGQIDIRVKNGMKEKPEKHRTCQATKASNAGACRLRRAGAYLQNRKLPGKQSDTLPSKLTFSNNICKYLLASRLPKPKPVNLSVAATIKVAKTLELCWSCGAFPSPDTHSHASTTASVGLPTPNSMLYQLQQSRSARPFILIMKYDD